MKYLLEMQVDDTGAWYPLHDLPFGRYVAKGLARYVMRKAREENTQNVPEQYRFNRLRVIQLVEVENDPA